eukprot:scaffold30970_cov101-Isochrysis_galbana.AAC.1
MLSSLIVGTGPIDDSTEQQCANLPTNKSTRTLCIIRARPPGKQSNKRVGQRPWSTARTQLPTGTQRPQTAGAAC